MNASHFAGFLEARLEDLEAAPGPAGLAHNAAQFGRALLADHRPVSADDNWCESCDPEALGVDAVYPCRTLRLFGAIWRDHPGYLAEWKS